MAKRTVLLSISLFVAVACSQSSTDTVPALGQVTSTASTACPAGAAPGAVCFSVVVSCAGLEDLGAILAVTEPTSPAAGTVYLHNNVGGTTVFDYGFVAQYLSRGLRVVQVQWAADWESSNAGIKAAACRYATLLSYAFTEVHGGDRTRAFCVQSFGGGSGGLAMSLAHYGAGSFLDAATISAGPPFARLDLGCDPTTPPRAACPEIPLAPVAYSGGVLGIISQWEASPACGHAGASSSDVARWQHDSVVSPDAVLDYPRTSLAAWFCVNAPDATVGEGSVFFDSLTSNATVHCVAGGAAGGVCSGEVPWPSALPDMVDDLVARCVPHH